MFKPIKDFLTFIQKNSSNTDVVGGDEVTATESLNAVKSSSVILTHLDEMNSPRVTVEKNGVIATDIDPPPDIDEDDIELQIKSSIMIKKQSPQTTRPPTPTTLAITATSNTKSQTQSDHNHNNQPKYSHIVPEEDDELADFKNDPMQNSAKDYCSVGSEIEDLPLQSADEAEAGDEFATEDDEDALEEKSYPELEGANKLFVAIDADLNSSISSSNNDDPLAIDIALLATETEAEMIVNPLDSSTQDEKIKVASNGEIVWYDTADIKNSTTVSIHTSDNRNQKAASMHSKQTQLELKKCEGAGEESNEEETEHNDNSDSGLGTETSSLLLQTTIENSIIESAGYIDKQSGRIFKNSTSTTEVDSRKPIVSCTESISQNVATLPVAIHALPPTTITTNAKSPTTTAVLRPCTPSARKPLRSNLKRRISDVDTTLDVDSAASGGSRPIEQEAGYQPKKQKRSITFDAVQVFYFPRLQGFGCVPSAGGCTLGMGAQHVDSRRLTLAEHAAELRRAHRLQMQEINPRGSSSEDTDESEEDYLSEGSGSDLDADSNGFLQPVTPKQRRALLKAAGVRKIDTSEKIECRNIRNSREVCGCTCRDFCDPETCTCSRAGIKCQVDRAMFPCGCSRDACGNTTGRVEFNPARVRTHFIHTIMRLDMENRQQQPPAQVSYDAATGLMLSHSGNNGGITAANYYNSIQPQSNYSSGYASPAYTTDSSANYMQTPNLLYPNGGGGNEQYHSIDSIDGGGGGSIYATNIAPSYGKILPNSAATPPTSMSAPPPYSNHAQLLNFPTSSYISYHPQHQPQQQQEQEHQQRHQQLNSHTTATAAANYLTQSQQQNNGNDPTIMHSAYRSCAVPSRPPYGTATTCSSSSTASDTNFISLDTPISSSSRLSQINDLLQHNRNTTAALVAVSTSICTSSPGINSANYSIETPPLNESQKACFVFDTDLAVVEVNASNKNMSRLLSSSTPPPPQSEPPPIAPTTIENLCNFSGGNSSSNSSGCNYPT